MAYLIFGLLVGENAREESKHQSLCWRDRGDSQMLFIEFEHFLWGCLVDSWKLSPRSIESPI